MKRFWGGINRLSETASANFGSDTIQQATPPREIESVMHVEESRDEETLEQSYISTTAGGDGLTFDRRLRTVYREIEWIKIGQLQSLEQAVTEPELPAKPPLKEDREFTKEDIYIFSDIPADLDPLYVLLESMQSLEIFKDQLARVGDSEREFSTIVQSIKEGKYSRQVNTCSKSLNILLASCVDSINEKEGSQKRIQQLESEKIDLHAQITQMKVDKQLMHQENKNQTRIIEQFKRLREENRLMYQDENRKAILDSQSYKEKVEKYRTELYETKKMLRESQRYQAMYEAVKRREDERIEKDVQEKTNEILRKQREKHSLMGHLKVIKCTRGPNISIFSKETYSFLEYADIRKIKSLSKKLSQTFLKHNSLLLVRLDSIKFQDMSLRIKDLHQKNDMQADIIQRNENRDRIKALLSSETGEETLRYLVDKYISRPAQKDQKHTQNQEDDENADSDEEGYTLNQSDKILGIVTTFVCGYLDEARRLQLQHSMDAQIKEQSTTDTSQQLNISTESGGTPGQKGSKIAMLERNSLMHFLTGAQRNQLRTLHCNQLKITRHQKNLDTIKSVDQLNDILYEIGAQLVGDKRKLAQWIRGLQEAFSECFIISRKLKQEATELHILKSFLLMSVESMKLKVNELLNDKEDMIAIHQSDSGVKEHLIQRINEQEKLNMERSTELLFIKRREQELLQDKMEVDSVKKDCQREMEQMKAKLQKDIKTLKDRVVKLSEENTEYQRAIQEMQGFFNKIYIE